MRRNKAFSSAAIPQNHLRDFILGTGCPSLPFQEPVSLDRPYMRL